MSILIPKIDDDRIVQCGDCGGYGFIVTVMPKPNGRHINSLYCLDCDAEYDVFALLAADKFE